MNIKLYLYAIAVWLGLAVIGVVNGIVRVYTYSSFTGEQTAHVISTAILICAILVVTYLFLRFARINYSNVGLIVTGAIWVVLTIIFEFVFGHYIAGHSWERLLADYNILEGRVWGLVLLTN